MIVRGAIVPHAPVLTLDTTAPGADAIARVTAAVRRLDVDGPDAPVIVSPHGAATGLYGRGRASLARFGAGLPAFDAEVDRALAGRLAGAWNRPLLDADLDHGVVVPLALLNERRAVTAATIAEGVDVHDAIELGRSLAGALDALAEPVALIASANTGASLTARAPLGLREESHDVERRLRDHLTSGRGDLDEILGDLAGIGGSCAAGPLAAFAEVFAGATRVEAYEAPFGVGYLVASAER